MTDRADYGSDDRHRHDVVRPELTGRGHAVRMRVKDGNELDRLALKGLINPFQHSAGSSFSRDLHGAHLLGIKTTSFGQAVSGGTPGEAQATALDRVTDAVRRLDEMVGPVARRLTMDACLSLITLSAEADLAAVQDGLDVLLSHYDRRHSVLMTDDLV